MKTLITICFLVVSFPFYLSAQNGNKPPSQESIFAKEIVTTVDKNLHVKPGVGVEKKGNCNPLNYIDQFNLNDLVPKPQKFEAFLKNFDFSFGKKLAQLKLDVTVPKGLKIEDLALEKLSKAKGLNDFVKKLTGKTLADIDDEDQVLLMDFYQNHPIKKLVQTKVKGKKVVKAQFLPCFASSSTTLELSSWRNYPETKWNLKTVVSIVCDCEDQTVELKEGSIIYKSELQAIFSTPRKELLKAKLLGPVDVTQKCCLDPEELPEETQEDKGPAEEYIPPKQTLGVNGGIGFEQDFEETTLCLGAEYLYKLTRLGNHPLYVGGQAEVATASFMDFSTFRVHVGPTIQLFSPITPSKEVHVTNGISGGYLFGTNDNNGFKDDLSGFTITLNTGLNVQLNENLAISVIIPVVNHQNLTLESQEGGFTSEVSNTTLLLNKNNPAKIGVRFGF